MRPFKSITGLSKWLLRFSLAAGIYASSFHVFKTFAFNSLNYFIHFFLILFGVLLVIGAFVSKHSLTVMSSLFIFIMYLFLILSGLEASLHSIIGMATLASMSMFFMANGNK